MPEGVGMLFQGWEFPLLKETHSLVKVISTMVGELAVNATGLGFLAASYSDTKIVKQQNGNVKTFLESKEMELLIRDMLNTTSLKLMLASSMFTSQESCQSVHDIPPYAEGEVVGVTKGFPFTDLTINNMMDKLGLNKFSGDERRLLPGLMSMGLKASEFNMLRETLKAMIRVSLLTTGNWGFIGFKTKDPSAILLIRNDIEIYYTEGNLDKYKFVVFGTESKPVSKVATAVGAKSPTVKMIPKSTACILSIWGSSVSSKLELTEIKMV